MLKFLYKPKALNLSFLLFNQRSTYKPSVFVFLLRLPYEILLEILLDSSVKVQDCGKNLKVLSSISSPSVSLRGLKQQYGTSLSSFGTGMVSVMWSESQYMDICNFGYFYLEERHFHCETCCCMTQYYMSVVTLEVLPVTEQSLYFRTLR